MKLTVIEGDVRTRDEGIVEWAPHPHWRGPGLPTEINDNPELYSNENHDIAIAMSPSRADPVLP